MPDKFRIKPLLSTLAFGLLLTGTGTALAQTQTSPSSLSTAQLIYQQLLSEIVAAQGNYSEAAISYIDLARRSGDSRLARRATEISMMSRQPALASEAARLWFQSDPGSQAAVQTLGTLIASNQGKPEELETELAAALSHQKQGRTELLQQLPIAFIRFPDKSASAKAVLRLTEPYLKQAEAHFARALSALELQDRASAEASITEALKIKPDWEQAALLHAQSLPEARRSEAMEALGAFGNRYPAAKDARLVYARWLASSKRPTEAQTAYKKLLAEFPDSDEVALGVVGISVQANDLDTTENLLHALIERGRGDTDRLRLLLGQVLEERKRPEDAINSYTAIAPGQHYIAAQTRLAQLLLATNGNLDSARNSLHEAALRSPSDSIALTLVEAQMLRQVNKHADALNLLETVLLKKPDHVEALYDSALLAERMQNVPLMEKRLRRVIELQPSHAHASNALGYSFADRNINLDEADKLLTLALSLAPEDPAILDSMGWLRFRQGRYSEALQYIRKAFSQFPDAEVASHLIEILWVDGKQDEARSQLKEFLSGDPVNPQLRILRDRLGM